MGLVAFSRYSMLLARTYDVSDDAKRRSKNTAPVVHEVYANIVSSGKHGASPTCQPPVSCPSSEYIRTVVSAYIHALPERHINEYCDIASATTRRAVGVPLLHTIFSPWRGKEAFSASSASAAASLAKPALTIRTKEGAGSSPVVLSN